MNVNSKVSDSPTTPATDDPGLPPVGDTASEAAKGNNEAAKYRRRLRETEAERDALNERITRLQRAEVERIAASAKVKSEALWASGAELEQLLDGDGDVEPAKVNEAVGRTREMFGIVDPLILGNRSPREGSSAHPNYSHTGMARQIAGR